MSRPVIQVHQTGKKFCKSLKRSMLYGAGDLLDTIVGRIPDSTELREGEFWAVDNLSFDLQKGETLGIIGANGSGKSTLLKMLNGIFMPDKGQIDVTGKVGALIEVGAGFHPMLSGRENVYINGSILGMSKKEIDRKFDEIVGFADIGDFIDAPVKHYSSGMFVRLGFAVAIHGEPDILLVDEILSVGDLSYAIKCHRKMSEFRQKGGTVIFVSHNLQAVRNTCEKVLWMRGGTCRMLGNVYDVCDAYENEMVKQSESLIAQGGSRMNYEPGTEVTGVTFLDAGDRPCQGYAPGENLKMRIHFDFKRKIRQPIFTVSIYGPEGLALTSSRSHTDGYPIEELAGSGSVDYIIKELFLKPAKYACSVTVSEKSVSNVLTWHEKSYVFDVTGKITNDGLINFKPEWRLIT